MNTPDWGAPNVTCTPTTMHCPVPHMWAHINYTTPSLYPEPAEGSCLQQKTGTNNHMGCLVKMNYDEQEHGSNNEFTQKYRNWAGNCGDATSYFWFEKIACGSTRTFYTDRSLIGDFVQLTPTWEDIQVKRIFKSAVRTFYHTTVETEDYMHCKAYHPTRTLCVCHSVDLHVVSTCVVTLQQGGGGTTASYRSVIK